MAKTYKFDCGCKIPIDETLPRIFDLPSLVYPDDVNQLPLDCPLVYEMLSAGHTKGIFQLESPLGKQYSKKLQPGIPDPSRGIEHLAALGALLRPGVLKVKDENGVSMTDKYCLRKNGLEEVIYYHPSLEPILKSTYGILCYQEQAMAIAVALARFSLQEADALRAAISKKKTDAMAKVKTNFIDKAGGLGIVTPEEAAEIFGWIEKSQKYSFNKCTSFDTKMLRRKTATEASFTVEEMYRIRNDLEYAKSAGYQQLHRKWNRQDNYGYGLSMEKDGRIRPNIIKNIQPSGVQVVFKVTLADGSTIRVTDNHKFPIPSNRGGTPLNQLGIGCEIYIRGRTKKGSKGYPSYVRAITSIEPDGECMTYNVTMDAPNHNFVVESGIVTCNSHAVSYALVGYHTAHAKAHFPLHFYTSYLYYAKEKQDPLLEIQQLVNDARGVGIDVLPPRFSDLKSHFSTDGVVITFGLSDVKGISSKQIAKIRKNAKLVEDQLSMPRVRWSWYDFLVYFSPSCPSNVVRRMIEVGATRDYKLDRQYMLAEYETYYQLTEKEQKNIVGLGRPEYDNEGNQIRDAVPCNTLTESLEHLLNQPKGVATKKRREKVETLLDLLKHPPRSLADTSGWIAKTEKECLGIPITCNPTDDRPNMRANTTCKEFRDGKESNCPVLAVTIQECREHRIQNGDNRGKTMAFLVVADKTGALDDVCIFSEAWEQYGNSIVPGESVEIRGRRDTKRGSFIVEEVYKS